MAAKNKSKPVSKTKTRLVTFSLLLIFAVGFSAYDIWKIYPETASTGTGKSIVFHVQKGIGPTALASQLQAAGIIESPGKLGLWLKLSGLFPTIKAGEFKLQDNMTPKEVINALQGRTATKGIRITIPEGYKLSQIAEVLIKAKLTDKDKFREACFDRTLLSKLGIPSNSAEGFLFPDTYYFHPNTTAPVVIEKMYRNFQKKTASLNLPQGNSLLELVTLASIVQAEAKVASEAPIIAGVYLNRLDANKFPGRRLQADPTVSFGCDSFILPQPTSCDTFKGTLGSKQLSDESNPYNTYRHSGLPPGPIGSPGFTSLRAVVQPKQVPYLYFVVSKDGEHQFSITLPEHQKAVNAYRQRNGN